MNFYKIHDRYLHKLSAWQFYSILGAIFYDTRKKMFGASSEKSRLDDQLSLFKSVQELAQEFWDEQKKITIKSHENTPGKSGIREEMLSRIKKELIEYVINEDEVCPT